MLLTPTALLRNTSYTFEKPLPIPYMRSVLLSTSGGTKGQVKEGEESVRDANVRDALNDLSEKMSHEKEKMQEKAKTNPTGSPILVEEKETDAVDKVKERTKGTATDIGDVI